MPCSNTDPSLHLQTTAPVGAKQLGLAEAAAAGQCQSRGLCTAGLCRLLQRCLLTSLGSIAQDPPASFLLLPGAGWLPLP